MKTINSLLKGFSIIAAISFYGIYSIAAIPGITLVGKGLVSGSLLDKSGLKGYICQTGFPTNCISQALFGGFGSALAYTGFDNTYIATTDRGPFDGQTDVPYLDRFHFLRITTHVGAPFPNIRLDLLDTRLFKNQCNMTFVGITNAFDVNDELCTLRFDPEGIRVGKNGTFFISDEYGPDLFEFSPQGDLVRRLPVPPKFLIAHPSADPTIELLTNFSGRQANRGMEGLAISPNSNALFGIMQSALLQDNGLVPGTTNRLGVNNRILKFNILTDKTSEYVYPLDTIRNGEGVNAILAINDHEFLVLEKDNRSNLLVPPEPPFRKNIYKIDVAGATNVSGVASLPAGALPMSIVPVSKTLFIDLLDPVFNLAATIPEKIEGLEWGPDLADGRHLLYVISDNDLEPNQATQIYAFAIEASLINFKKQIIDEAIYPCR